MYLGEQRRRRQARSSPARVVVLLILIGISAYIYGVVRQGTVESTYSPTPTPTRSALSYATEAEALYMRGDLQLALVAYDQAIMLDPSNLHYRIQVVRLLTLSGETDEATQIGKDLIQIDPDNARAWTVLGNAYDWSGRVADAIEACERAVQLDPAYAEGYACLAEAYVDDGQWQEANDTIQTALELDDHSVDVHRNYGYILETQGNWSGAIDEYKKAVEIRPNLAYIHVSIGQNYRALGSIDSAIQSFQRALEISPTDARANYELGWTYLIYQGDYELAQKYLLIAIETDPEYGSAHGALALTYWARRNYEEAIPQFEQAIKLETAATRQEVERFLITIEDESGPLKRPSSDLAMRGEFVSSSPPGHDVIGSTLEPVKLENKWKEAQGTVSLDTVTGKYTLELTDFPSLPTGKVYVGWFDYIPTLSRDTLGTRPLQVGAGRDLKVSLETGWVAGPPIEDFYTLGLAYFYLDECDKAYPLFDAALQIDPEEKNALDGVKYCQQSDAGD